MDIHKFWQAVLRQDREKMAAYFHEDALVNWHNTDECFTAPEFIRVNCEYPGQWDGNIQRVIRTEDCIITATHIYSQDREQSFHAVSFIHIRDDKIVRIDEYWGDDGAPPQWRQDMGLGRRIKPEGEVRP